jgi:hypothetical protein
MRHRRLADGGGGWRDAIFVRISASARFDACNLALRRSLQLSLRFVHSGAADQRPAPTPTPSGISHAWSGQDD